MANRRRKGSYAYGNTSHGQGQGQGQGGNGHGSSRRNTMRTRAGANFDIPLPRSQQEALDDDGYLKQLRQQSFSLPRVLSGALIGIMTSSRHNPSCLPSVNVTPQFRPNQPPSYLHSALLSAMASPSPLFPHNGAAAGSNGVRSGSGLPADGGASIVEGLRPISLGPTDEQLAAMAIVGGKGPASSYGGHSSHKATDSLMGSLGAAGVTPTHGPSDQQQGSPFSNLLFASARSAARQHTNSINATTTATAGRAGSAAAVPSRSGAPSASPASTAATSASPATNNGTSPLQLDEPSAPSFVKGSGAAPTMGAVEDAACSAGASISSVVEIRRRSGCATAHHPQPHPHQQQQGDTVAALEASRNAPSPLPCELLNNNSINTNNKPFASTVSAASGDATTSQQRGGGGGGGETPSAKIGKAAGTELSSPPPHLGGTPAPSNSNTASASPVNPHPNSLNFNPSGLSGHAATSVDSSVSAGGHCFGAVAHQPSAESGPYAYGNGAARHFATASAVRPASSSAAGTPTAAGGAPTIYFPSLSAAAVGGQQGFGHHAGYGYGSHHSHSDRAAVAAMGEIEERLGDALPRLASRAPEVASPIVVVGALRYLAVAQSLNVGRVEGDNWFRLFFTALMVSCKMHLDLRRRVNKAFAEALGVTLKEMNALEVELLYMLDFNLLLSEGEYTDYAEWLCEVALLQGKEEFAHRWLTTLDGYARRQPQQSAGGNGMPMTPTHGPMRSTPMTPTAFIMGHAQRGGASRIHSLSASPCLGAYGGGGGGAFPHHWPGHSLPPMELTPTDALTAAAAASGGAVAYCLDRGTPINGTPLHSPTPINFGAGGGGVYGGSSGLRGSPQKAVAAAFQMTTATTSHLDGFVASTPRLFSARTPHQLAIGSAAGDVSPFIGGGAALFSSERLLASGVGIGGSGTGGTAGDSHAHLFGFHEVYDPLRAANDTPLNDLRGGSCGGVGAGGVGVGAFSVMVDGSDSDDDVPLAPPPLEVEPMTPPAFAALEASPEGSLFGGGSALDHKDHTAADSYGAAVNAGGGKARHFAAASPPAPCKDRSVVRMSRGASVQPTAASDGGGGAPMAASPPPPPSPRRFGYGGSDRFGARGGFVDPTPHHHRGDSYGGGGGGGEGNTFGGGVRRPLVVAAEGRRLSIDRAAPPSTHGAEQPPAPPPPRRGFFAKSSFAELALPTATPPSGPTANPSNSTADSTTPPPPPQTSHAAAATNSSSSSGAVRRPLGGGGGRGLVRATSSYQILDALCDVDGDGGEGSVVDHRTPFGAADRWRDAGRPARGGGVPNNNNLVNSVSAVAALGDGPPPTLELPPATAVTGNTPPPQPQHARQYQQGQHTLAQGPMLRQETLPLDFGDPSPPVSGTAPTAPVSGAGAAAAVASPLQPFSASASLSFASARFVDAGTAALPQGLRAGFGPSSASGDGLRPSPAAVRTSPALRAAGLGDMPYRRHFGEEDEEGANQRPRSGGVRDAVSEPSRAPFGASGRSAFRGADGSAVGGGVGVGLGSEQRSRGFFRGDGGIQTVRNVPPSDTTSASADAAPVRTRGFFAPRAAAPVASLDATALGNDAATYPIVSSASEESSPQRSSAARIGLASREGAEREPPRARGFFRADGAIPSVRSGAGGAPSASGGSGRGFFAPRPTVVPTAEETTLPKEGGVPPEGTSSERNVSVGVSERRRGFFAPKDASLKLLSAADAPAIAANEAPSAGAGATLTAGAEEAEGLLHVVDDAIASFEQTLTPLTAEAARAALGLTPSLATADASAPSPVAAAASELNTPPPTGDAFGNSTTGTRICTDGTDLNVGNNDASNFSGRKQCTPSATIVGGGGGADEEKEAFKDDSKHSSVMGCDGILSPNKRSRGSPSGSVEGGKALAQCRLPFITPTSSPKETEVDGAAVGRGLLAAAPSFGASQNTSASSSSLPSHDPRVSLQRAPSASAASLCLHGEGGVSSAVIPLSFPAALTSAGSANVSAAGSQQ